MTIDVNKIQNEIDSNEKFDEYNIYNKTFSDNLNYKLSKDEFYNLCLDNKRQNNETFDEYKLRRKKVRHYGEIKKAKLYYPSNILGTLVKNELQHKLVKMYTEINKRSEN